MSIDATRIDGPTAGGCCVEATGRAGWGFQALPADLSLRLGRKSLVKLILAEITAPDPRGSTYRDLGSPGSVSSDSLWMTLLAYCYLTGVLGSEEIVRDASHDAMTRYICGRIAPTTETLRDCRRRHRTALERLLERVLGTAWGLLSEEDGDQLHTRSIGNDATRTWASAAPGLPDFRADAVRRLELAIRADSLDPEG